jgi:hypothetical protein
MMGTLYRPRGMCPQNTPKGPTKIIDDCGNKVRPRSLGVRGEEWGKTGAASASQRNSPLPNNANSTEQRQLVVSVPALSEKRV